MFADFQRKFRQRLSNALLSGAFWVVNTAPTATLLRLVGTYIPPASGSPVTSDILQLIRTSVGSYRLYLYPERTDRGISVDWTAGNQTLSAISSDLILGTGAYSLTLDNSTVRLIGGTSNVAVDVNRAVTVVQIGNTATAGSADVTTGSTEFRGKTAASNATTNIVGGAAVLAAGDGASGSAGAANGGSVNIYGGAGYGTGTAGYVNIGYTGSASKGQVKFWVVPQFSKQSTASTATLTPVATTDNMCVITALAANLTIANPTGTPDDMQLLVIRITDNGTARTIGFGTQYRTHGASLPTTTVATKSMYLSFRYDAAAVKWDLLALSTLP